MRRDQSSRTGRLTEAGRLCSVTPVWLDHASRSPTSSRVRHAVERVASRLAQDMQWPADYVADREALRALLGRLVGAAPADVALTHGTGHGISLVANGLDWRPGDNVVSARWEYPSNLLPWMALEHRGVELRLVDPVDGRVDPSIVFDLVDECTRVVSLSFVQFWNGFRPDVAAVGAECRRHGIVFVVDGVQGVGAVRLDVQAAGIDLLAASGIKWLMGPHGIGFAYAHPALGERLRPPLVSVSSVEETIDALDPELRWAAGARRFEESAPPWFETAALLASVGLLEEVGFDVVEAQVLAKARRLGEGLAALGFDMAPPWPRAPHESSGIVALHAPGHAGVIAAHLQEAGVTVRARGDFVRFSPHFSTADDEIDRALEAAASARQRVT